MVHDPLCDDPNDYGNWVMTEDGPVNGCTTCSLIKRVREDEGVRSYRLGYLVGWGEGHEEGRQTDPVTQWLADHLRQDILANDTFNRFANGSSQNVENPKTGGGDS
jgi:hypothetical protein